MAEQVFALYGRQGKAFGTEGLPVGTLDVDAMSSLQEGRAELPDGTLERICSVLVRQGPFSVADVADWFALHLSWAPDQERACVIMERLLEWAKARFAGDGGDPTDGAGITAMRVSAQELLPLLKDVFAAVRVPEREVMVQLRLARLSDMVGSDF